MPRTRHRPTGAVVYFRLDPALTARLDAACAVVATRDGQHVSRPEYVRRLLVEHLRVQEEASVVVTTLPTST